MDSPSSADGHHGQFYGHHAICVLFCAALRKWVKPAFFEKPTFFPGVIIRVLWAAIMCCIISPLPSTTALAIALYVTALVILPLLTEVIVDEWHAFKHRSDPQPPIAEMDDEISWEYVARLKSSNNGYDCEQFYWVTMVDFSEMDDPFWPHASTVYMVEIRRRCQIWRTITIWQVSVLNGGRKKFHTFHDFCQWTDANWFGRWFEIQHEASVHCFQTNGVVIAVVAYCGSWKLYIHDIRCGKSNAIKMLETDLRYPISICCLGRLVIDGAVEGWRIRLVSGFAEFRNDQSQSLCARITQKVLDLRGLTRCHSHEELMFGNFEPLLVLFPVRTSRGHFGLGAMNADVGIKVVAIYDPLTGKYDRCMSEEELRQSDRLYNAVTSSGQFVRRPMVLTDRECITGFGQLYDGTVLRAQFATPTLKYRTAKTFFRAKPKLRSQMNAEQFRQVSGIDGIGGHFR